MTHRVSGVGSIDETFDQQLIAGRPFIQFDNFRGHFDSPHLEAFLTAFKLSWYFFAQQPQRANAWFAAASQLNVTDTILDTAASVEPNRFVLLDQIIEAIPRAAA